MSPALSKAVRSHVVQVSTSDTGGGAERVALDLHRAYEARGMPATLALGRMTSSCCGCLEIPNDDFRTPLTRAIVRRLPGTETSLALATRQAGRSLAEPGRAIRRLLGRDDFDYPATRRLLELVSPPADLLHLHNVHGGYFDLTALPALTKRVPTVVTMHDMWLLTGHCAYSLDCEKYLLGCGGCPYPHSPPAMMRDASAHNLRVKRDIFSASALHLVGCSEWILSEAERSILAPALLSSTLIRNGVDQSVFAPGDRTSARSRLGLPPEALVIMFSANRIRNPYKDFDTLLAALPMVADALSPRRVLLLAVGAREPLHGVDERSVRVVPYIHDQPELAAHLQCADLYVHATRADNYPLSVLEAQSCGVPVVVTDVGGAPETIDRGVTGVTYTLGDVSGLAAVIADLLSDLERLDHMRDAALSYSRSHHSLDRMVDDYLALYDRILEDGQGA